MSEPIAFSSSKKQTRSVPCPDPLHPFSRTTIEMKSGNEEEVAEVVHCLLLTSSAGHEVLTFDYAQVTCFWTCESHNNAGEKVKFTVQMFRRKTGAILVEWQRLMGSSPRFFELYKQCKSALTSGDAKGDYGNMKPANSCPSEIHKSRSDSAPLFMRNNCDTSMALSNFHPILSTIPEEELQTSRKALEAWLAKDPNEAEVAVRKLSLSTPYIRDALRWLPSAQEV